jgi:hypothetical protein
VEIADLAVEITDLAVEIADLADLAVEVRQPCRGAVSLG